MKGGHTKHRPPFTNKVRMKTDSTTTDTPTEPTPENTTPDSRSTHERICRVKTNPDDPVDTDPDIQLF